MNHDALALDVAQELRQAARRLAQNAEIMHESLAEANLPDRVAEEAFLIWWRITLTPGIEFPDFSKIFRTDNDDDLEM